MPAGGVPEHVGQRTAQLERGLRGNRLDVGHPAHPIGTKQPASCITQLFMPAFKFKMRNLTLSGLARTT